MTEVKITESDADPTDLYRHYQGQSGPQSVYVELDMRDGELSADYDGNVGPGTTFAVHDGLVLQFAFPAIPTVAAANAVLAAVAPLAQAVLDTAQAVADEPQQAYEDWGLTPAQEAHEAAKTTLRDAVDNSLTDEDVVAIWNLDSVGDLDDIYAQITAETTDAELDEIEALLLSQLADGYGAAVCDGLRETLEEERESERAGRAFA